MTGLLDELLAEEKAKLAPIPPVLACPGCQDQMEQHEDHGRCPHGCGCWVDGISNRPVIHQEPK